MVPLFFCFQKWCGFFCTPLYQPGCNNFFHAGFGFYSHPHKLLHITGSTAKVAMAEPGLAIG